MIRYLSILTRKVNYKPNYFSSFTSVGIEHIKDNTDSEQISSPKPFAKLITKTIIETIKLDSERILEKEIYSAENVNQLLSIVNNSSFNKKHALHILSILNNWKKNGKVEIAEYQNDPRFSIVSNLTGNKESNFLKEFALILEDQKEQDILNSIASLSVPETVKILSTLAQRKKRNPLILRTISNHLAEKPFKLSVKEIANILYAISVLNYPDEILLQKSSEDLLHNICDDTSPNVIKSILTSLGHLKYKNTQMLDCLSNWIQNNIHVYSNRGILAAVTTLAILDHVPSNDQAFFQSLKPFLVEQEMSSSMEWLQMVWSLVILGKADEQQLTSVLTKEFIHKLNVTSMNMDIPIPAKLKLFNINGYAKSLSNYKGPLLDLNSEEWNICLLRSKEKSVLVSSILNTFSNLFSSEIYLKTNIDTKLGFFLDAECCLDEKLNPLPIDEVEKNSNQKHSRIGILIWDYNDICRGTNDLGGIGKLYKKLLALQGYKILEIPYTEFSPREKILLRVKYLESKLKEIVQQP